MIVLVPVAVTLGLSDGIGHAHLAGWYDDELAIAARVAFAVHPRVAIDTGITEDTERVELGLHAGVRVRPTCAPWFYLRGDVALVGASHLGSNYDLTTGGRGVVPALRLVRRRGRRPISCLRVGELETQSLRLAAGVAIASPRFWHRI